MPKSSSVLARECSRASPWSFHRPQWHRLVQHEMSLTKLHCCALELGSASLLPKSPFQGASAFAAVLVLSPACQQCLQGILLGSQSTAARAARAKIVGASLLVPLPSEWKFDGCQLHDRGRSAGWMLRKWSRRLLWTAPALGSQYLFVRILIGTRAVRGLEDLAEALVKTALRQPCRCYLQA